MTDVDVGCLVVDVEAMQVVQVDVDAPASLAVGVEVPTAYAVSVSETGSQGPPGPPGPPGESTMAGYTVDTDELYKVIMFSDGTVRAVPFDAEPPALPAGLAPTTEIGSVLLEWSPAAGAAQYAVYRDGAQVAVVATTSFRDRAITVGQTYAYSVQAISAYGLRSGRTPDVTAFVDPALNRAPTVEVRSWPASVALGSRAVVRVNASDLDAQQLALALGTDVGSLVATADPSVWILIPS